jgi:hypothetical protein
VPVRLFRVTRINHGRRSAYYRQEQALPLDAEFPFWRAPWIFAIHGIVGTSIFAIIAALAVVLYFLVNWLAADRISVNNPSFRLAKRSERARPFEV